MRKKIIFALLLVATVLGPRLFAQRSEVGFGVGTSFYLGDINPKVPFYNAKISASLLYRYNIDTRWAFRFSGNYGRIAASDADFKNPRGLNFRNDLVDIAAMMEVNYVNFFTGSKQHRFTPYLAFGVAVCFSNPYGLYPDPKTNEKRWVALRPLHTEGQGLEGYEAKEYSLAHFAIPFGLGFKVSISRRVALGLEWTMRFVTTDYLDDVSGFYADRSQLLSEFGPESFYFADPQAYHNPEIVREVGAQRGDKGQFDWYSFLQFTVSIRIGEPDHICPAYSNQTTLKKK